MHPGNITEPWNRPVEVWEQFCDEARLRTFGHNVSTPGAREVGAMNTNELCSSIGKSLPALFECTLAVHEGVRVRTQLLYPDGGVVDVFVLEREGNTL